MKKAILAVMILSLLPLSAFARKTTYIATNQRFNYVKIKEVSSKEAQKLDMTHPKDISEDQMRSILSLIKLSKRQLFSKEIDTQTVFDENAVEFLAPALVRAFREATPNEHVVISYVVKRPYFIIRNDRLSIADMWIHDNELHISFQKLYAKLLGDTDKRGAHDKQIANARGLRVDLDLQPGQMMAVDSDKELIVDLNHDFVAELQRSKELENKSILTSDTKPAKVARETKGAATADTAAASTAAAGTVAAGSAVEPQEDDVQSRLEQLEKLKKSNLITNKEYKEKKKEILKDL